MLYWKRVLNECGVDWTDMERVCSDRDGWKKCVSDRMRHLERWERQQGHRYVWGPNESMIERNDRRVLDLVCRYEGCGKVCKSKGGLVQHQKRKHRAPEERVRFECSVCGMACETEVACMMHERSCAGGRLTESRRECGVCGEWMSRTNYARHVRSCGERGVEGAGGRTEGTRGRVAVCPGCGRELSYSNMARHQRSCRVWDPGGGPSR